MSSESLEHQDATRRPQALQSNIFSTETLTAGLNTLDFQQCKVERMEKEIQDSTLYSLSNLLAFCPAIHLFICLKEVPCV